MFDLCPITKYICAFCSNNHCGIGITKKDRKLKKVTHINELKDMIACPLEAEEKKKDSRFKE